MKITFIGTSDGYPEIERFCSCTAVTVNGKHYVIDAGVSLYSMLVKSDMDPADVNGIFITHMHGDHASGLVEFLTLKIWGKKELTDNIFVPTRMGKLTLEAVSYAMDVGRDISLSVYKDGPVFEDENVKITAYRTTHGESTFGFLVEAEGKKVYFTGDLSGDLHDIPELVYNDAPDAVICESAHNVLPKIADKFNAMNAKQIIINHIAKDRSLGYFDEAKPMINKPFTLAYDGMTVEI